jgi:hypothetical protein
MNIVVEIRKFLAYLAGKKSEVQELELKDVVMAKSILDIHRKRTHKELTTVPLFSIRQIHVLDRENARQATQQRVETLQAYKEKLLVTGTITCDALAQFMPSVSWIKVVQDRPGGYLAFEGNSRLAAMQEVFAPSDGMKVEVEQYHFRNTRKIVRRLNRVRRLNGLLDNDAVQLAHTVRAGSIDDRHGDKERGKILVFDFSNDV